MTFMESVQTVFSNYATFVGRAKRSEFWWWVLFVVGASIILNIIDGIVLGGSGIIGGLFSLATLVPGIAVTARRLHDIGRSGWWQLIAFIPLLGLIVMIYFCVQPTQEGENDYGSQPA